MYVSIVTPFGEKSFEMGEENALALIRFAQETASPVPPAPPMEFEADCPVRVGQDAGEDRQIDARPDPVRQGAAHGHSRVEAMFGSRDTWNTPVEVRPEGYTGFLLLRCEECGEVKAFCAKQPTTHFRCDECGHSTDLHDLLPVHAYCKCGRKSKYRTNIESDTAIVNCVECGAPIDLELNHDQTAYVTVGVKRGGGGY